MGYTSDQTSYWVHIRLGQLHEVCGTIVHWDGEGAARLGARSPDSRRDRPGCQSGRIVAFSVAAAVRAPAYCVGSWTCVGTGDRGQEGRAGRTCDGRVPGGELALAEVRGGGASPGAGKQNRRARSRRCSPTPRRPLPRIQCTLRRGCPTRPGRQRSLLRR